MWWIWLLQKCVHLLSFLSARFHKPNTPHAVNCIRKHYCNAFFLSPCQSLEFSPLILPWEGWEQVRRGCSVYSAPLAWLPACLLIALYSECLRPMWGVAVGSIGCNVTKHIRDGYSRLVKARRSIHTPFCHSALLSSPSCTARLSLCLCLFWLLCRLLCFCLLSCLLRISFMSELSILLSRFFSALSVYS